MPPKLNSLNLFARGRKSGEKEKYSTLPPNYNFLSQVVDQALDVLSGKVAKQPNGGQGLFLRPIVTLVAPFGEGQDPPQATLPDPVDKIDTYAIAIEQARNLTESLQIQETTSRSTAAAKPAGSRTEGESLGVVFAQLFLVLSVLSVDPAFLRLPAVSSLSEYETIGSGKSFIARRIPRENLQLGSDARRFRQHKHFVYKSIRHTSPDPLNEQSSPAEKLKNVLLEIQVLTHEPLRYHENIVHLIGFGWETNKIKDVFRWPFLVLEFAEFGSLADVLEEHIVGYSTRRSLCIDVALGLSALHDCGVIHGDVKSENVLIFPHHERGFIAKLSDFGYSWLDSEDNRSVTGPCGRTFLWQAPECGRMLLPEDVHLTDVYSYGFLVWRTVCHGNDPFTENHGQPEGWGQRYEIEDLKKTGKILHLAVTSLEFLGSGEFRDQVEKVLQNSLQVDPHLRGLETCITALGGKILQRNAVRLRRPEIPPEQGCGIYEYPGNDLRLRLQFMRSLECYCQILPSGINVGRAILTNGSSTLASYYFQKHELGDIYDVDYRKPTLDIGLMWLAISAGGGQAAMAEALFSVYSAFSKTVPESPVLKEYATEALLMGMEFIRNDVLDHQIARKAEFIEKFRTILCGGSGQKIVINKERLVNNNSIDELLGKFTLEFLLQQAAIWGCKKTVVYLVTECGANVNAQDEYGETALLKACRSGHYDLVKWLVGNAQANPALRSKNGVTALHCLTSFDDQESKKVAALLGKAGANPNAISKTAVQGAIDNEWWHMPGPPLMRAIAKGHESAVRALLKLGADPKDESHGESPISFAARRLRAKILSILLDTVPDYSVTALARSGRSLIGEVIASHPVYGIKIHRGNYWKSRELTFSCLWGFASRRKIPIYFASVDARGTTPLSYAVEKGDLGFVKYILGRKCTNNIAKQILLNDSLQKAILYGHRSIFIRLLQEGANPLAPVIPDLETHLRQSKHTQGRGDTREISTRKTNCLHLCSEGGQYAAAFAIEILKSARPDLIKRHSQMRRDDEHINCCAINGDTSEPFLDCRNERDETPLFLALEAEEYTLAYFLYKCGANKNAFVRGKRIVEHILGWSSSLRCLSFLVDVLWGCLRLTLDESGREVLNIAAAKTASLPKEEARAVLKFLHDRCYEKILYQPQALSAAAHALNKDAVSAYLDATSRRGIDIATPFNIARQKLFESLVVGKAKKPEDPDHNIQFQRRARRQLWDNAGEILLILKNLGSHSEVIPRSSKRSVEIVNYLQDEFQFAIAKHNSFRIGQKPVKLANEVRRLLDPFLCSMTNCTPDDVKQFEEALVACFRTVLNISLHFSAERDELTAVVKAKDAQRVELTSISVIEDPRFRAKIGAYSSKEVRKVIKVTPREYIPIGHSIGCYKVV